MTHENNTHTRQAGGRPSAIAAGFPAPAAFVIQLETA